MCLIEQVIFCSRNLELGARCFIVQSIDFYQRHLSPRKGFRCAFGVLHGGESCSQIVKHRVLDGGVRGWWKDARRQFALCGEAAELLRAANAADSPTKKRHRWKRKRADNSQDQNAHWCDAAQCACHAPDVLSCCARTGGGVFKGAGSANDCSPCDGDACSVDFCGCWP